jgi:hypothetical protein
MAAPTLAPVRVPTHPQLSDVLDAAERLLIRCDWQDEACDCRQMAVVHHIQSELEFCLRHFRQWEREGREIV